jgi:hypothetical protein
MDFKGVSITFSEWAELMAQACICKAKGGDIGQHEDHCPAYPGGFSDHWPEG